MPLRAKHLTVPVSIIAGIGAAFITSAVAQSGGTRSPQSGPPFSQTGAVVALGATLSGPDENTGAGNFDPDGTGSLLVTINTTTNEVCGNVTTANLTAFTNFHLHIGPPAPAPRTGSPVIDFAPPAGTTGSFSKCVIDTDAAAIAANPTAYYANVHTTEFTGGAISGQLAFRTSEMQLLGAPIRVYDTCFGGLTKFAPNTTRTIDLSAAGIPVGATGALVTVTVTQAEGAGFLTVYSNALGTMPNTSNVNFTNGEDIANNIIVATDGNNKIKISSGATGTEDVIVDVVGYEMGTVPNTATSGTTTTSTTAAP